MVKEHIFIALLSFYCLLHAIQGYRCLTLKLLHLFLNSVLVIYDLFLEQLNLILKSLCSFFLIAKVIRKWGAYLFNHIYLEIGSLCSVDLRYVPHVRDFTVQSTFKHSSLIICIVNLLKQVFKV